MNLIEILNNSILLEAVRINNGKEAYELIKNNKLGVKMHPSYKDADNPIARNEIIIGVNEILDSVENANNNVFTIQLFINKVPLDKLRKFSRLSLLHGLINYRTKPWAKEIPEYKDFIELNNKDFNTAALNRLSEKMIQEAQNHGHGNKKEVKELYNDGTWSLQIPLSFNGARSISFYGKKGEEQIPTKWCTRASKHHYDSYTQGSPLYIIRNWETGKSYQMSINRKRVDFLDQEDTKGDEITKGDFSLIPDDLLKKIKYNDKETMLDFKKAINEINDKMNKEVSPEESKKLNKLGYFNDATTKLEDARWSNPIKVNDKISKRIFLNFGMINKQEFKNPMSNGDLANPSYLPDSINDWKKDTLKTVKGKSDEYYTKHNGKWSAVYYFNDYPDVGFVIDLTKRKEKDPINGSTEYSAKPVNKIDGKYKIANLSLIINHCPNFEELLTVARKDFGADKSIERRKNKANEEETKGTRENIKNIFNLYATKYLLPIINNRLKSQLENKNISLKVDTFNIDGRGGILPSYVRIYIMTNEEMLSEFYIQKDNGNAMKYKVSFPKDKELEKDLNKVINNMIAEYSKEAIKDKNLKSIRINDRSGNNRVNYNRLQLEEVNYFPY